MGVDTEEGIETVVERALAALVENVGGWAELAGDDAIRVRFLVRLQAIEHTLELNQSLFTDDPALERADAELRGLQEQLRSAAAKITAAPPEETRVPPAQDGVDRSAESVSRPADPPPPPADELDAAAADEVSLEELDAMMTALSERMERGLRQAEEWEREAPATDAALHAALSTLDANADATARSIRRSEQLMEGLRAHRRATEDRLAESLDDVRGHLSDERASIRGHSRWLTRALWALRIVLGFGLLGVGVDYVLNGALAGPLIVAALFAAWLASEAVVNPALERATTALRHRRIRCAMNWAALVQAFEAALLAREEATARLADAGTAQHPAARAARPFRSGG